MSRDGIRHLFQNIEAEIKEHKILLENIYNFDEKGFMIGIGKPSQVITTSSEQPNKRKKRQDGNRELITVIVVICANSSHFLLTIIYKGLSHQEDWYDDVVADDDVLLGHSEKEYTNNKLGLQWLRHFHDYTEKKAAKR